MKKVFSVIFFLISLTSFSQQKDTYQSDSIMKSNNIKTKILYSENSVSKAKNVYNFDKLGRLTEYILTDNYDENGIQMKISYFYNETGKIIKEIDSSYGTPKPTVEITEYTYTADGNYKAIQFNEKKKKKIICEIIFQADSSKEIQKLINYKGEVYRENISYYERPNYTYKFTGFEKNNGSSESMVINGIEYKVISEDNWLYLFNNKFDDQGRIIERVRVVNGIVKDKSLYTYDSTGLLTEKMEITYDEGKEWKGKELFKYVKWE